MVVVVVVHPKVSAAIAVPTALLLSKLSRKIQVDDDDDEEHDVVVVVGGNEGRCVLKVISSHLFSFLTTLNSTPLYYYCT